MENRLGSQDLPWRSPQCQRNTSENDFKLAVKSELVAESSLGVFLEHRMASSWSILRFGMPRAHPSSSKSAETVYSIFLEEKNPLIFCLSVNNTCILNSLMVGWMESIASCRDFNLVSWFSALPIIPVRLQPGFLGPQLLQGSVQSTESPRGYMCIQAVGSFGLFHWLLPFHLSFHLPKIC